MLSQFPLLEMARTARSTGLGALTVSVITLAIPSLTTVGNASAVSAGSATLTTTLTRTDTGAGIPSETVQFSVNGVACGTAVTDVNGNATLPYAVPAGTAAGSQPIAVTFAGDSTYAPLTGAGTLTISNVGTTLAVSNSSAVSGGSATLSANLNRADTNAPISGEQVIFSINGTQVGAGATDVNGNVSVTYAVPTGTPAGSDTITASFAGDTGFASTSGNGTLTINAVGTTLAVANASAQSGSTVSLTAVLTRADTGAMIAGEQVSFSIGSQVVGTATTDSIRHRNIRLRNPSGIGNR